MSAEEPANYTNLFLAPVPKSVRNDDLFQIFKGAGATSASVMMDVNSGRSKGFAFIAFESSQDGEKALRDLSGTTCTAPTGEVFTLNLSVSSHKKHQSVIESNVVYFRNLPLNAPVGDIRTRLEKYGKIANLTQKPDSNQKFLLATVEFEDLAGARAAVSEGHGKVLFPEHSTFPVMCKYADNYATKQARRQRRQQHNDAAEKDSFSSGGHSSGFSSGNEWGGSGSSGNYNHPPQAAMHQQGNPLSGGGPLGTPYSAAPAGLQPGYPAQQHPQQMAGPYAQQTPQPPQAVFYPDGQPGSPNNFSQPPQQYQPGYPPQQQQASAYQSQQYQQYLNQQQYPPSQQQQPQQYQQAPQQQQQYQPQYQQPQSQAFSPQMQGYPQQQQQQFGQQQQAQYQQPQQQQSQPQAPQQVQLQVQQQNNVTTTVINADPVAPQQHQRPLGGGPMDADDGGHSFSTGQLSRGDDDSHSISSSDSGKYRRNPYSNTGPVTIQVDDRRNSRTSSSAGADPLH